MIPENNEEKMRFFHPDGDGPLQLKPGPVAAPTPVVITAAAGSTSWKSDADRGAVADKAGQAARGHAPGPITDRGNSAFVTPPARREGRVRVRARVRVRNGRSYSYSRS